MKRVIRVLLSIAGWVALAVFLAPVFFGGIWNPGNMLGAFLSLCMMFRFSFSKYYHRLKERLTKKKAGKVFVRAVQTLSALFIIYAVVISALMIGASLVPPKKKATAIVLGAQVESSGPSLMLSQRIDAVFGFLQTPGARAVLSGGQGDDEPLSEAQCMYEELTARGVTENLLLEDRSANTPENIRFSYRLIKERDYFTDDALAIVTDSFHQFRARLICRREGVTEPIGAVNATVNYQTLALYPTFFVREWLAIPAEIFIR